MSRPSHPHPPPPPHPPHFPSSARPPLSSPSTALYRTPTTASLASLQRFPPPTPPLASASSLPSSSPAAIYTRPTVIPPPSVSAPGSSRTATPATLAPPTRLVVPPHHGGGGGNGKDGLIRMLLQNAQPTPPPPPSSTPMLPTTPLLPPPSPQGTPAKPPPRFAHSAPVTPSSSSLPLPPSSVHPNLMSPPLSEVKQDEKANNYIYQIDGREREIGLIILDHSYSRPWNYRPEIGHGTKPTRYLFVTREPRNPSPLAQSKAKTDEIIDVMSTDAKQTRPLDPVRSMLRMEECERFVSFSNPNAKPLDKSDEWEERISKECWTGPQHRLFNRVMKVLHADRLARLANHDVENEPLLRRITVDKSAKRVRQVLSGALWDTKLTQWLHLALVDNLPTEYLASYLDIMQTLKGKIPTLADKMMSGKVYHEMYENVPADGIRILLNSKWDPASSGLSEAKLKKLPGNPVIILTPSGPCDDWNSPQVLGSGIDNNTCTRSGLWQRMLSQLGNFVRVSPPVLSKEDPNPTLIGPFLHKMVTDIIAKIREVKRANDRPVILVGWGVGAAINCQVAAMEPVAGCVCLGFPMFTLDGSRGDADDPILELRCPVLFVVGELATQCRPDDVEDMRERMRAESGMVLVGGADDHLRVSKHKKNMERVTQSMVDRCIMDEIRDFFVAILTAPPPPTFALPSFIQVPDPKALASATPGGGAGGASTPGSTPARKPAQRRRKPPAADGSGPAPKRSRKSPGSAKAAKAGAITTSAPGGIAPQLPTLPLSAAAASAAAAAQASPSTPSGSITPVSLPTTPLRAEIPKARKFLDMSPAAVSSATKVADNSTARMMASSPLLSSALTSPTKANTHATVRPIAAPMAIASPRPLHQQPPPMPMIPQIPTSTVIKHPLPVPLPTMPTLAAVLRQAAHQPQQPQRPHPPPISASSVPRFVNPPKSSALTSSAVGATLVTATKSAPPPLPSTATNMIMLTAPKTTLAALLPGATRTATVTQTRFATLPTGVNIAHVVKKAQQAAATAAGTPGVAAAAQKDSLYVIALPPDQLKHLDSSRLMQYPGGQMVTLVSGEKAAAAIKTKAAEAGGGNNLIMTPAGVGTASAPDTSNTVDKRNVAEILASLSGLVPEPPSTKVGVEAKQQLPVATAVKTTAVLTVTRAAPVPTVSASATTASGATSKTETLPITSATISKPTPSILSSTSSSGRVVRVLQTGTSRPAIHATPLVLQIAPSLSSGSSSGAGGSRSRKQVFVTNEKKEEGKETDEKEKEMMRTVAAAIGQTPPFYEQDILEEDVNDIEYIPYQKRSKAKKMAPTPPAAVPVAESSSSGGGEQQPPSSSSAKKTLRSSTTRKST